MKKTIIAVLALASVVACNKSEVLETTPAEAITFGSPFIENSTKAIDPSHPAVELAGFNVYGTVAYNGKVTNIFNGVEVSKTTPTNQGDAASTGGNYGYATDKTQYWVEGNTYDFAAIAGAAAATTDDNGMPATIAYTYDNTKQVDLLYAHKAYGVYNKPQTGSVASVNFTFDHLLSLVKFTFTNNYAQNTGFDIKVTDVTINNPYASATYTIANQTWAGHTSATTPLAFGNATADDAAAGAAALQLAVGAKASSNYQRLMIPGTYEKLLVSFKVEVIAKDSNGKYFTIDSNTYTDVEVPDVTFTPGYSYNLTANVTEELDAITFTVEKINAWRTPSTPDTEIL